MIIVETSIFTRLICSLLPEEEIRRLQIALLLRPDQGTLIRGAGGLRKVRWNQPGRGKRGGLRIFYYWDKRADHLYMIFVIEKTRQADLTPEQTRALGRVIREELK